MSDSKNFMNSKVVLKFEDPNIVHDRVLIVGERKFYVLSQILSLWSEHFRGMFNGDFSNANKVEIELFELDADLFEIFLRILYHNASVSLSDASRKQVAADFRTFRSLLQIAISARFQRLFCDCDGRKERRIAAHLYDVSELLDFNLLKGASPKILILDGPHIDDMKGFLATEAVPEKKPVFTDPLCYIYTSGTTGLPKAAVIKHFSPAIWRRFQERFNVGRIAEFYGSTEGTSNLVNIDGHEGSYGFMTILPVFAPLYPVRLFRVNSDGELHKDDNGYLDPIKPGECGALACTIKKNNPLYHFEGYLDKQETAKKVIREPRPGADPVFLSGDILYWDRRGYFYFKDRMGDTFRWKGENVSTTEVEAVLCGIHEIVESTVYGIELPGCEGRAGMAALVFSSELLIESGLSIDDVMRRKIYDELTKTLPSYAVPLFIRIQKTLDKTGTFKMKKTDLQKAGFGYLEDSTVFYLEQKTNKTYLPLMEEIKAAIERETFKF